MPSPRANITPETLSWARDRAGYDTEQAARKAGVREEVYAAWELGERAPTLNQAVNLAKAFNCSLATLYRKSPPDEGDPVAEMRRPRLHTRPSPRLIGQIRLAFDRRDYALSLFGDLGEAPPQFSITAGTNDDPEDVGAHARRVLDPADGSFRGWRSACEDAGVLVFQIPGVEFEQMNGFAIADRPLPVIAYNSKMHVHRRLFTLLHELGHCILRDGVLHQESVLAYDDRREQFCNHFAAAALVPYDLLSREKIVKQKRQDMLWTEAEIVQLGRRYGVSGGVMIRRLYRFDLIASEQYRSMVEKFDSHTGRREQADDERGNAHRNRRAWLGTNLSKLAFRAYAEGFATERDLSEFFGLHPSKLSGMENEVFGSNVMFQEMSV